MDPTTVDKILKDIDAIKKLIKDYPEAMDYLTPEQQAIVKALIEKEETKTKKPKKKK